MATAEDYLTQLQQDKTALVNNLNAKGVSASNTETFTQLVPKVLEISGAEKEKTVDVTLNDYGGLGVVSNVSYITFVVKNDAGENEIKFFDANSFFDFFEYTVRNVVVGSYVYLSNVSGASVEASCLEKVLNYHESMDLEIYKVIESDDYTINFEAGMLEP